VLFSPRDILAPNITKLKRLAFVIFLAPKYRRKKRAKNVDEIDYRVSNSKLHTGRIEKENVSGGRSLKKALRAAMKGSKSRDAA